MAQRRGEPFSGEATTEQTIKPRALSAHATDETTWFTTGADSLRCSHYKAIAIAGLPA